MAFECPKISGLRPIKESDIPLDKSVQGEDPSGPVDGQTAYDIYRKLMLSLHDAGYQLEKHGASFGLVLQQMQQRYSKDQSLAIDKLQSKFVERAGMLAGKGFLSVVTEYFLKLGRGYPFSRYNPLTSIEHSAFSKLLISPGIKDSSGEIADSVEFLIDFIPDETSDSAGVRYFLHDWLTGCAYVSDSFVPDPPEQIIDSMLQSTKDYLGLVSLEAALDAARRLVLPWPDEFRVYSIGTNASGKTGWRDLVETFREITLCASNFVNQGFDLKFEEMHIVIGAFEMTDCPNEMKINEGILNKTQAMPIKVNGGIEMLTVPVATNAGDAHCFKTGDGLELIPNTEFPDAKNVKIYRYQDKYDNTVIAVTVEHWSRYFACIGDDAYLAYLQVYPKIFFGNSRDTDHQIDLDLSPIGLGEYKNLAYVKGLPHVLKINDGMDVYSDHFSADQFSEQFSANVERGVNLAAALFELERPVTKVIVRKTQYSNAAARELQKDIIYIVGKDPNELVDGEHGWIVPMHETLHVIESSYGIGRDPEFTKLYNELQPPPPPKENKNDDGMVSLGDILKQMYKEPHPFMKVLAESKWFGLKDAGHPWDDTMEFFVSLCLSLMHPDITARFNELSAEDQHLYIRSLEVLQGAIDRSAPKAPNLTISRRIGNTLEVLRPFLKNE